MLTPDAVSAIAVDTFRLNGALIAAGDKLGAPLGLTSARWQVMGAIALAGQPGPVAHVARNMGLTRQNVRRIVGDLVQEGLLALAPNPHHRRAALVVMTPRGAAAYGAIMALWAPRAAALAEGISAEDLATTLATLRRLHAALAVSPEDENGELP
jgi:DNA-binding MarR family transcriptional regulator